MSEPIETSIERFFQAVIKAEFGDDFPVYRSTQAPVSEDIECVIVSANREADPFQVIEGGSKHVDTYNLEIQLWSLEATEDSVEVHDRLTKIDDAVNADSIPADVDASAFSTLVVAAGVSTQNEIDQETGRRTRTRTYRVRAVAS